jgi:multidrug resistance protein
MARLIVLMITAFVDMVGLLIILPLLPFYALDMGGTGLVVGVLVSSYAFAQLLSAPLWGRVSDRYGRRPAILVSLAASALAYVIFAFASTLWILLLSRLVQGAGGGTVGVVQAYVADVAEPENRAKSLGWLSAATSLGVMVGPGIGSLSSAWGSAAPGLIAAGLCLVNIAFAWRFLRESREPDDGTEERPVPILPRQAVMLVLRRPGEPAPRLIWMYAVGMGAFQGMTAILALFLALRFGITEATIGYVFMYVGAISVLTRAAALGPAVDRYGELRLSRLGLLLLGVGLATIPLTHSYLPLLLAIALVPLGTAFTFPCVTSLLSRAIGKHERGLYMGVQQTFGGAARVIGPIGAGWAYDHLGVGVPFWVGAALVVVVIFLGFGIPQPVSGKPAAAPAGV